MSKIYTTVQGDTFDMVALRFFDEEKMASAIIQANPDYCDTLIFEAGVELKIPENASVSLPDTLPPWRR